MHQMPQGKEPTHNVKKKRGNPSTNLAEKLYGCNVRRLKKTKAAVVICFSTMDVPGYAKGKNAKLQVLPV